MLGRQTFLNCGMLEGLSHGCNGGDVPDVLGFMAKKGGLPDETCLTYKVQRLIAVRGGEEKRSHPFFSGLSLTMNSLCPEP